MLDVNGRARVNEVVVNTTGADFVFEADYRLLNLKDLKVFIERNKHLPGIPTAQQMIKDRVNLGELNIKLLQKIEELTLHLIEKEKQLEIQAVILSKVEERLKKLESKNNQK